MLDDLLPYYEKELSHLRLLSREFANQYPKIAGRLQLEGDTCEDPHAERLIESFAFIAARIHKKLDDDFPEIAEAFLNVLYPHYLRPTPSLSIAQFDLAQPGSNLTGSHTVARHTELLSQTIDGTQCKFRTCYPVEIWPVSIADAQFRELERSAFTQRTTSAAAQLRLTLRSLGSADLSRMGLARLRFFLDGEPMQMYALYELLFNNLQQVALCWDEQGKTRELRLPANSIKPVGFGEDEGLLDYGARSFMGYRLLHEYFALPEKFLFFDVDGLAMPLSRCPARDVELVFYFSAFEGAERLSRLGTTVGPHNFKLGCTPVVNLFKQHGEPIKVTQTRAEYPIIPDLRRPRAIEVISVDAVRKVRKLRGLDQVTDCKAFFDPRHDDGHGDGEPTYWTATRRRATGAGDAGTEVFISLVDREFNMQMPAADTLSLTLTCSNRDLPQRLPFGGAQGDFTMEGESVVKTIRCLRKPSAALRPRLGKGTVWRLISHLSLNHLSLVSQGRDALLDILSLYNLSGSVAADRQIRGVLSVNSHASVSRISHPRPAFVRGTAIELAVDEDQFIGGSAFLFGAVLSRFFGLYCTLNSFTQLTLRSRQREMELAQWPPQTGSQP